MCEPLRRDVGAGIVRAWYNVMAPGDRQRRVDMFVGEPNAQGFPDVSRIRIALENKSVITAHRNRTNRFDDLQKVLSAVHRAQPLAILLATVLVGMCDRVLNVPDHVKKLYRERDAEFARDIAPRLSTGDQSLWTDFSWAISRNRVTDPQRAVDLCRQLPTRAPGHTHVDGYDYVLLVPVDIDNVNPPAIPRPNALRIDVDEEYPQMLARVCSAYIARWHM
ncbi:MAG TPA: hypothetical protein VKT77_15700 [Chthonomonadaceae bacterium]|nr:hypothetical protein [Chthonomonadaceae bacterium]